MLVEVLYAPVNHNDLLVMGGKFPYHPELPAVQGNEAVARVTALNRLSEVAAAIAHTLAGGKALLDVVEENR